nr:Imm70 family immunity protein [Paenibacillus sp. UNC217MF]
MQVIRVRKSIPSATKKPPWGEDISPKVTNLSNYFATSDG